MVSLRSFPAAVALALVALSGCDSAEDDSLAGRYETTQFLADTDGDEQTPQVDVLALGASVTITLREDGSVQGRILIPESLVEQGEPDTPFAGTYTVAGNRVTFDHEADTFVRDATWTLDDGQLRTESFNLAIVLEKD